MPKLHQIQSTVDTIRQAHKYPYSTILKWQTITMLNRKLGEKLRISNHLASYEVHIARSHFLQCRCYCQYIFDTLKCGKNSFNLCRPVRLPWDVFMHLKHTPFPVPGEDGHHLPFSVVFGSGTSEEHCPYFKHQKSRAVRLPSYATIQHIKNLQLMF